MGKMKESEVHLHQDPLGRALRVLTPGSYLRLDECKTLKKPRFDRIWQLVAQMIKNLLQLTHLKRLMLGKIEAKRSRGWHRIRWLDSITDSMDMNLSKF